MASYPGAVKTFTSKSDGAGNRIFAAHINDLQDEVTAIEDGLLNGTAPINSSRITAASVSVAGNSTVAANFSVGGAASVLGSVVIGGGLAVTSGSSFSGDVTLNAAVIEPGARSTALSTGDNHNIVASGVRFIYMTTNSSGSTVTGFAGAGSGHLVSIFNAGPSAVLGLKNSSGSVSSNQLSLPSDTNLLVGAGATFYHSAVVNKWVRV